MNRVSLAFLGLSLLAVGACRGGGNGGDDDDTHPDSPPGGAVHIQDIQNDAMPKGTAVSLSGVVVTAIDSFGSKTGDLWVEEPGGGEFSGVKVFGAPLDVLAQLKPGDIVDITNAEKDEFALMSDMSGRTTTEIKGAGGGMMSIVKTGTGTVPAPASVDAVAIAAMPAAQQDAEWEKWEGVLITVTNVSQTSVVKAFGSAMPTPDDSFKFEVNGKLVVESTMAKFPTSAAPEFCFASITGIGDYFFDHLLLPRVPEDFGAAGAAGACPSEVGDNNSCHDGIDNDFDGFKDCEDISCQLHDATCTTTTTIAAIQSGTATGSVVINDVFVTGISGNKKNFYISQNLAAAPNEGVFVFRGGSAPVLDASVVVGAKVNVTGTVQEFNDDQMGGTLTEIAGTNVTFTVQPGAPGTVVPATGKTAAQLLDATTGPMFESVLVTLDNVKVTTLGNAANGFIATATQNGQTFGVSTDVLRFNGTAGQGDVNHCYATVTGFWTNLEAPGAGATTKPNAFGFIPLTLGADGTNCN